MGRDFRSAPIWRRKVGKLVSLQVGKFHYFGLLTFDFRLINFRLPTFDFTRIIRHRGILPLKAEYP
jgi:hypothetical protein